MAQVNGLTAKVNITFIALMNGAVNGSTALVNITILTLVNGLTVLVNGSTALMNGREHPYPLPADR